jgi:hypothetical protein
MFPQLKQVFYQQEHRLDLGRILNHWVRLAIEWDLLFRIRVIMDEGSD